MDTYFKNGIQLPAYDVELLASGRLIAVPFKHTLKPGQAFWLYPSQQFPGDLSLAEYYKPEHQEAAKVALRKYSTAPIELHNWAVCESHCHIHAKDKHLLPKIAQTTIWNREALERLLEQTQVLKLLFLKVHHLPKPCIVNTLTEPGIFFWAKPEDEMVLPSSQDVPSVSPTSFKQRKLLLLAGRNYPLHTLELLQAEVGNLASTDVRMNSFNNSIKRVLGWASKEILAKSNPEWVNEIAAKGNRSLQEDDGTTNYHAGTAFEKVVRESLETLGFKVDYSHKGGAGGIDIFCSEPYALVGECKSGKKIPNDTVIQLLNLGTIRLENKEEFNKSAKLIIGPGTPTEQVKKAAKIHGMAIINPATLENLVKLHCQHPIDLFKLKDHLIDGAANEEIEKFISETRQSVALRSLIVQQVKNYLENADTEDAGIYELHAVYAVSKPSQTLKREEMLEILIELSSPLLGYLGRRKDKDGNDRFYFLRDLKLDN